MREVSGHHENPAIAAAASKEHEIDFVVDGGSPGEEFYEVKAALFKVLSTLSIGGYFSTDYNRVQSCHKEPPVRKLLARGFRILELSEDGGVFVESGASSEILAALKPG